MGRQAGTGGLVPHTRARASCFWSFPPCSFLQTGSVTEDEEGVHTAACGKPGALSWLYGVEQVLFLRSEFSPWQTQPASLLGREPSQSLREETWGPAKVSGAPLTPSLPLSLPLFVRLLFHDRAACSSLLRNLTSGISMEIVLPFFFFFWPSSKATKRYP